MGIKIGHLLRLVDHSACVDWVLGILSLAQLHSHSTDLFTFGFLLSILLWENKMSCMSSVSGAILVLVVPRLNFG